jgi:tryptophan synthase alpha chain
MAYVVARKGVTGSQTAMGDDVLALLERCRRHTDVPIGVGFGVSSRDDLEVLRGAADVAIVGTAALRAWQTGGADGLRKFFNALMA